MITFSLGIVFLNDPATNELEAVQVIGVIHGSLRASEFPSGSVKRMGRRQSANHT